MGIFSLKYKAFGLDISDRSFRYVYLKPVKRGFVIKSFGESKLPGGIIEKGEIKDEKGLEKILRDFFGRERHVYHKSIPEFAVVSLPEEKSFVDVIELPQMSRDEMRNAVAFELENIIPMSPENVYFDFESRLLTENRQKQCQEVVVAATPKEVADTYYKVLKKADIDPLAFEIECFSIVRAVVPRKSYFPPSLIVDIGRSRTTFVIYSGKEIRLTFSTLFSSATLDEVIAKKMEIPKKKAEKLKIEQGLLGEAKLKKIITAELAYLTTEIKNHLHYYYSHEARKNLQCPSKKIERIVLCGGGANLRGLDDFIAQNVKLPVILANPWVNVFGEKINQIPPISFEKSLSFTTALGLALKPYLYD